MRQPWIRHSALGVFLFCAGCNLFNPSGEGDTGGGSAASLSVAEELFRNQDFAGAMAAFQRAIEEDSTSALAYYGYSKAALRYYRLNASVILDKMSEAKEDTTIPFLADSAATLTQYLQATSRVQRALDQLTKRDTLTRWYGYYQDSNSAAAQKDPKSGLRAVFMRDYFAKADLGQTGFWPKSSFPLSDRALAYEKIVVDMSFVKLLYALVHLRDLDQNDTIDNRDNLLKLLNFKIDKGLKVENLKDIADSLNTPENRDNLNKMIQNASSGLSSAAEVLKLLNPQLPGTDTLSNQPLTDKVSQNIDSVIKNMGGAITFYQFGDSKDNDGDGCVDEEIIDGKDNDADGLTDEDARVIPIDNVDNDHNGSKDLLDDGENLDSFFLLKFSTDPAFIKGALYPDKPFRVRVQAESLTVKTSFTQWQRIMLDSAKAQVGGCWNHY